MAGGLMMAAGLRLREIILVLAVPAAIAAGCFVLLGIVRSQRKTAALGRPLQELR